MCLSCERGCVSLPVGVEPVEEILNCIIDSLSDVPARVQSDDSPGHQRDRVQVTAPDDVESLVEILQTVNFILILKQEHLPEEYWHQYLKSPHSMFSFT